MIPALKKPLALFSHLVVLIFSGLMIYFGSQMTLMMFQDEYAKTATLQIPEYCFYAILPLMGCMTFVRTITIMSAYTYIVCKKAWMKKRQRPSFVEAIAVIQEVGWALFPPILIFGGIYSGLFTANEAAVVACFYAFFVETFIHKDMKLAEIKSVFTPFPTVQSAVVMENAIIS
jgi:hypothetical protein